MQHIRIEPPNARASLRQSIAIKILILHNYVAYAVIAFSDMNRCLCTGYENDEMTFFWCLLHAAGDLVTRVETFAEVRAALPMVVIGRIPCNSCSKP